MLYTEAVNSVGGSAGLSALSANSNSMAFPREAAVGIIHDLGNLIQIASSAIDIVARNPSVRAADLEPVIAGARSSLERAGALVKETIGRGRQQSTAVEKLSLGASLRDIESLVQLTWDRGFLLEVRANPDLPAVRCNAIALQNAVLNLLFNARDAMPNGGLISIEAEAVSPDLVELRVADHGIGMTPDTIVRALDPFFTTKADGLGGVGLPMVERFIHEAGGQILIESEYGVGTTVCLQFPVLQ